MKVKIIDASSPDKSSILKITPGTSMISLKEHIIDQEFSREKKDIISDLRFIHDISDITQEKQIKNASITEEKNSTKPNYFDKKYNNEDAYKIFTKNNILCFYYIPIFFPIKVKYKNTKHVIEINDDKPLNFYEKVIKKQFHLEGQNIEYKINGKIIPSDLSIHSAMSLFDYHNDYIKIKSFNGSKSIVLCIQVIGIDGSFKKFKISFFPERKIKKIKKHLTFNQDVPSEYIDSAFFTIQNGKKFVILDENQSLNDCNIKSETIITCYAKDSYIIKYRDDIFPFYEKKLTYEGICLIIQSKYNIQKDDILICINNQIYKGSYKLQNGTKIEVNKRTKINLIINYKKDKINISIENTSQVNKINYLLRKQFGSEYQLIRFIDNENKTVIIPEYLILAYFGDDDTKTYDINAEIANKYMFFNTNNNIFYSYCLLPYQTFSDAYKEMKFAFDEVCFVCDERILQLSDKLNVVYDTDAPIDIYDSMPDYINIYLTFDEKSKKQKVEALFIKKAKVMNVRLYASKIMSIENENDIILYDTKDKDRQLDDDNEELSEDDYYLNAKAKERKAEPANYYIGVDEEKFYQVVGVIEENDKKIVYKVKNTKTNNLFLKVVWKIIKDKTGFAEQKRATDEYFLLYNLDHPSICRAVAANPVETIKNVDNENVTTFAMFTEFIENNLKDCLDNKMLDNTTKTKIVVEIAHGMSYIHKKGLIFRSLNIDSIRLNSKFEAKIVDFSHARLYKDVNNTNEEEDDELDDFSKSMFIDDASSKYMSPEMLNDDKYDYKTDVYSFGIVVYYIFVGSLPRIKMRDKMMGKPIQFKSHSDLMEKYCADLISKCLSLRPG